MKVPKVTTDDTDAAAKARFTNPFVKASRPDLVPLDRHNPCARLGGRERDRSSTCSDVEHEVAGLDVGDETPDQRRIDQEVLSEATSSLIARRTPWAGPRATHGGAP